MKRLLIPTILLSGNIIFNARAESNQLTNIDSINNEQNNNKENPEDENNQPINSSKPNIVLIVTDDQAYETMKCWGGNVYTPNIDRLANEGMKFERAYAASSISAASRYSILSGRYAGRCTGEQFMKRSPEGKMHYIDNVVMTLEKDRNNLPKSLKSLGYTTGMVGKWHLGYHFNSANEFPTKGLKYYAENADPRNISQELEFNHKWYSKRIKEVGFDFADNIYWGNLKEIFNKKLNYHNIDWTVEGAKKFINENKDRPFFLYFSTTLHHGPTPQNSIGNQYKNVTSKGYIEVTNLSGRETLKSRLAEHGINEKYAYTLWLDDAIGEIMKTLEDNKLDENTLIIYLSDHGLAQKASLYEGGVKTPMMAWWKGHIQQGSISSSLISTCDFAPTLLEIAGLNGKNETECDGKSFKELFTSPNKKIHETIYSEIGNARAVITKDYKYIAINWDDKTQSLIDNGLIKGSEDYNRIGYIGNRDLTRYGKENPNYFDKDQLFDLSSDKNERNNLINNKQYSEILSYLKKEMKKYIDSFGRPFRDL